MPLALFQDIEIELREMLFLENEDSHSGDETDDPIQFIKKTVERVKKDFDEIVVDEDKKHFQAFSPKFLQHC